tara:strand:- start:1511 stop:1975 length:465 start_codon:yes stop_codon:yes gene_type:complete
MKKLLSLLAIIFTINLHAQTNEVELILENKSKPIRVTNIDFSVDKNGLGRAWLTIDLAYNDLDSFLIQTVRTKIPGLVHDVNTNEILLNDTRCATTKKVLRRRLFRKPKEVIKVEKTGDCEFNTFIYRKLTTIDDGYDVVNEKRFILKLIPLYK